MLSAFGLLVGHAREWARKDVGLRAFALTALLGMLSSLVTSAFTLVSLVGVPLLVAYLNLRSVLRDVSLEITTSLAVIVTMVLGVLVGHGHLYTPVASAVVMTMLLSWKSELSDFADDLSREEIRQLRRRIGQQRQHHCCGGRDGCTWSATARRGRCAGGLGLHFQSLVNLLLVYQQTRYKPIDSNPKRNVLRVVLAGLLALLVRERICPLTHVNRQSLPEDHRQIFRFLDAI